MKQLILIALFSFYLTACCSQDKKQEKKPNIIYVLADDLGYGDVAAFNKNGKIPTPNLDKLAGEGMSFTDAHTSSAVCTPTRYGILTGRYNWRSDIQRGVLKGTSDALIHNDRSTVASILKESGYTTSFIGKWHLGWNWARFDKDSIDFSKPVKKGPNDLGFDYAFGHCGSLDMPPYVYVENGMPTMIPTKTTTNPDKQAWWREGLTADDFVHEDVTPNFFNKAVDYIKKQAGNEKPFFLYLPLPSPHTPILPTEEYQGKSGLENSYADFVMMVDDYMGTLLSEVKKAGVEDNTLIIFTSDNGCSPRAKIDDLMAKGHNPSGIYRGHKADIFEGGHRVPFIAKWPGVIAAGSIDNQTICTTDFMATAAAISGYELKDNEAEDSYNMMPLFTQKFKGDSFREATVHHSINGSFAIRKGNFKLILCSNSGGWSYPRPGKKKGLYNGSFVSKKILEQKSFPDFQLYNLKEDPSELINLQAEMPEKVIELKALLTKYILDGRSTKGVKQQNNGGTDWPQLKWMKS